MKRAALGAALLACAGLGIPDAELPAARLAVRYLEPEPARQLREEALAYERGAGRRREGVPHLDDIRRYLRRAGGATPGGGAPERTGHRRDPDPEAPRLALLDPARGRVEPVAQARRGAVPVAWSPDRSRLLFTQLVDGYPQLFELDLARAEVRPQTREPRAHPGGCYGPGGRLVVVATDFAQEPPQQRLELTAPGGRDPRPLTDGPYDGGVACAPDGAAVAWVSWARDPLGELFVMAPVPGGEPRSLGRGREPAFAPDGHSLVYSAPAARRVRSGGRSRPLWQLRRVRVDGGGRISLGHGALDETEPAISPDGRLIAYVGVSPALERALYLRRWDGSDDRLLFADGDAIGPVW